MSDADPGPHLALSTDKHAAPSDLPHAGSTREMIKKKSAGTDPVSQSE